MLVSCMLNFESACTLHSSSDWETSIIRLLRIGLDSHAITKPILSFLLENERMALTIGVFTRQKIARKFVSTKLRDKRN